MEKNKFRKISKKELLEIMLNQAKRIKELETELNKTQEKLDSKKIIIEESGSLAEASLKLNSVFEQAQLAIEQYKYNVEEQCKKISAETKKQCKSEKEKIIKETTERCKKKENKLDEKINKIDEKILKLRKKEKELKKKEKEIFTIKNKIKKNKELEIKPTIENKKIKSSKVDISHLNHMISEKEAKV